MPNKVTSATYRYSSIDFVKEKGVFGEEGILKWKLIYFILCGHFPGWDSCLCNNPLGSFSQGEIVYTLRCYISKIIPIKYSSKNPISSRNIKSNLWIQKNVVWRHKRESIKLYIKSETFNKQILTLYCQVPLACLLFLLRDLAKEGNVLTLQSAPLREEDDFVENPECS